MTTVLRPMEQSASWTFALALALLKLPPEPSVADALDEFLLHSSDVLQQPLPFAPTGQTPPKSEFTLRGILYTGVSAEMIAQAKHISSVVHADILDTLRVMLQTDQRVPVLGADSPKKNALPSRLPADAPLGEARVVVYVLALLQERNTVLRIAEECFDAFLEDAQLSVARNLGKAFVLSPTYALEAIKTLDLLVSDLLADQDENDELAALVFAEKLLYTARLLAFLHTIFAGQAAVPVLVVSAWFAFMEKSHFTLNLGRISSRESFSLIHALSTVVTLLLVDLGASNSPFWSDPTVFARANSVIVHTPSNSIIRYAWLLTLYKASVVLDVPEEASAAALAVSKVADVQKDLSTLQFYLQNTHVFREISELNKFLQFDNTFAITLSALILDALPVVTMNPEIASCVSNVLGSAPNATVQNFFESEVAQREIILARAKFPASISPYLRLAAINGTFALHEFQELKSYMSAFNEEEFGMLCDIDLENTDLVKLTKMVDVYPPFEVGKKLSMVLGFDTKGKIIPTERENEILVAFLYKYNGWALLGRILKNISTFFDITQEDKMLVLEDLLDLCIKTFELSSTSDTQSVLDFMSAYVDDSDVVDILFRLLEQTLHNRSVTLLGKLLQILATLMPVVSSRIWPYLSTCSLLSLKGKEGFLSILFSSIEMVSGDYSFTTALVRFVFAVAENCLQMTQDYPSEAKSGILARFVEHLVLVFESYPSCKFNDGFQKLHLGVLILDAFRQILEAIYMIDPKVPANKKPTKVFAQAASSILEPFLLTDSDLTRSASPIFQMIEALSASTVLYEASDISGYIGNVWVHTALSFARLLLVVRSLKGDAPSRFEKELFARLPQLVTIYSRGGAHRKVVLDLISALTSGVWDSEPMPSMLAHLGRDSARIFLHSLATDLANPFDDYAIKISIYDLLCSIMGANQQGLSVLFISGRDVFGGASQTDLRSKSETVSLLSIMKKNVSTSTYYPFSVTVHLLDAIALAFNSWATAGIDDSDPVFVKDLVGMMDKFEKPAAIKRTFDFVISSYDCKVHAKVAEILSLVLFTTRNEKCKETIIDLLRSQDFIEKIPGYLSIENYSTTLYDHVQTQFEQTFPNYKLAEFSVAIQKRNRFGYGAVYDLLLMDPLFQSHPNWGHLRQLIVSSSTNIQYYNAQIALSRSIGALIATFCRKHPNKLSSNYSVLITKLLAIRDPTDSYTKGFNSENYFERVELAFLLAYSMNGVESIRKSPANAIDIVEASGALMASQEVGYLNGQPKKDGPSYRSLLRLVYIALSNLRDHHEQVITRFGVLLDFFEFTIAKGTKNIIIELQNDVYLSRTNKKHVSGNLGEKLDDLKLILSILKCYTTLHISPALFEKLFRNLEENGTVETVLSLYSFSHLILVNDEPLFAQLSLMFVQQLLTVETFADKFANANLFMVIRESVISQALRNGGVTLLSSAALLRNWTNGILPILVSALARSAMINEVIITLWAFSKQIETCIESSSRDLSTLQISSAATWETIQILSIYQILSAVTKAEGISETNAADVDMPMLPGLELPQKREDFVNYVENLLKHPKFLASRIVASTPEEAAMIKAGDKAYHAFVRNLIEEITELKEFLQ